MISEGISRHMRLYSETRKSYYAGKKENESKMLKSKKLKRVLSIIVTSVFCMVAFSQTLHADDYALKGTISSALEIMEGKTEWDTQTDGKINIKLQSDTGSGEIFTAYKLLNIEKDAVTGMLKVTIPNGAKPFWNSYTGKDSGVDATVLDIKAKIKEAGETAAAQSSDIINKFIAFTGSKPTGKTSDPAAGGKTQITTEFGFYAILQTGAPVNGHIASAPVLACLPMQDPNGSKWLSEFTIVPKDDEIRVEKKVHASDEPDFKDETITKIGDTVTYEIIAELPEYGADILNSVVYSLKDKLPEGVTIKEGTLNVTIERKGEATFNDAASLASASYNGADRTITLTVNDYAGAINKVYDKIKITYDADLNENAVIEGLGNVNNVTLEYSSYVGQTATTTADAKVYTMGLDITKIDADGGAALAGAEFEVYTNNSGTGVPIQFVDTTVGDGIHRYRVATQDEINAGRATQTIKVTDTEGENKGKLMLDGLDNTTYYFKETKAPKGYNLPDNLVDVNVQPTDSADYTEAGSTELAFDAHRLLKEITNTSGIDLPVTGGIGTIIFTVIGLLLMSGAAYFLFFSRKRNAK